MKTVLPQNDSDASGRAERLAAKRETYRFAYDWPPGLATGAELPKKDNYGPLYLLEAAKTYAAVGINVAAMALGSDESEGLFALLEERFANISAEEFHKHVFSTPKEIAKSLPPRFPTHWREYEDFFATWDKPPVVSFYDDDAKLNEAFGWQRVGGVNPMVLARVDTLPPGFGITDAIFQQTLEGDTLQAAIAEQRLYIANYAALENIPTGKTDNLDKFMCAPIALFAVPKGQSRLTPIAIQLGQTTDAALFTPQSGWLWRMAMQAVQIADANVHESMFHLGRTHMVMEAVKLCMERQLDESHPLHRLLEKHVETTMAINHSAKTSLIAPGGTVDQCFAPTIESLVGVVASAVKSYSIRTASPVHDLETRGLTNTEVLEHPYRDDALLLWKAIEDFVADYIDAYYESNEAVAQDMELQAFVRELGAEEGGRLHDVPELHTTDDLKALISKLVFIAGPGHSAVNFAQFPFMGPVFNMVGASFSPMPTAESANEEDGLTKMLPPLRIAMEGVTMVYFLSGMHPTKLGHYPPFHFRGRKANQAVHRFQKALEQIETTINERDGDRLMTYPFLKPSLVLQSIAI
ncbi:MAG: lipoxygenase family protein [Myxococcota bacterium]